MAKAEPFTLNSKTMGCLPVLNHFLDRIGLSRLLDSYLPGQDSRLRLLPATVIGVAVPRAVAPTHHWVAMPGPMNRTYAVPAGTPQTV